jgi:hypothetical protein
MALGIPQCLIYYNALAYKSDNQASRQNTRFALLNLNKKIINMSIEIKPKIAILVLSVGNRKFNTFTLQSIQTYATKIGASLIVEKRVKLNFKILIKCKAMKFNRKNIECYIQKAISIYNALYEYDRVLLLDDSCLITNEAPSIFDIVPLNHIAAYPESEHIEYKSHKYDRDFIFKKRKITIDDYFNTGVLLVDSTNRDIFSPENVYKNLDLFESNYPDQAFFNYMINAKKVNMKSLSENWNYMTVIDYTDKSDRDLKNLPEAYLEDMCKQYFIHVTGYYKYRENIIEQIFKKLT